MTLFILMKALFILGGTNTSRFTLTWFVQYMAAHPNIQDELYEEIVSNVGKT